MLKKQRLPIETIVLTDAIVETMAFPYDTPSRRPDSVAFCGGHIVAVGKNLAADDEFRQKKRICLDGATICPGFVDSHAHIYATAVSKSNVRLHDAQSLDVALERITTFARRSPERGWVFAEGMYVGSWRKPSWPTAEILEAACPGRPLFVYSKDYHSACVNLTALKLIGYTRQTANPDGGVIERDIEGFPSGVLRESPAYLPALRMATAEAPKNIDQLFTELESEAHALGITGVHSFDSYAGCEFLRSRARAGMLRLRVSHYLLSEHFLAQSYDPDLDNACRDWFRVAGVKQFADGSMGSQTALCFHKYNGSTSNYGVEVTDIKKMISIGKSAAKVGLASAIHAIGDRAVSNVLDVLEKLPHVKSGPHRIEHVQQIRRADITRLKKCGAVASMQPSHLPTDIPLIKQYWKSRINSCFLTKLCDDLGIPIAFGSDSPIEPLNPIGGITDAVCRRSHTSRDVLNPSERLSTLRALHGFTAGAAYAAGEEKYSGSVLPGMRADLVILDTDLRRASSTKLARTKTLATILDGKCVYSDGSLPFQIDKDH